MRSTIQRRAGSQQPKMTGDDHFDNLPAQRGTGLGKIVPRCWFSLFPEPLDAEERPGFFQIQTVSVHGDGTFESDLFHFKDTARSQIREDGFPTDGPGDDER